MFTVHSRGVFTQDKSGYFSNSKVYGKMGPGKSVHYKGVFTNQGCSLLEVSLYIHFHSQMQIRFFSDGQVHIRASLYFKFSITNTYLTPSMVIVVVADSVTR